MNYEQYVAKHEFIGVHFILSINLVWRVVKHEAKWPTRVNADIVNDH